MNRNPTLLSQARQAWESLDTFRRRRRRAKDFTLGRQWGDRERLSDGRTVTDAGRWLDKGVMPVSNNLIRQLVRSIIGHWRHMNPDASERDARLLEEYIISGCAIQYAAGAEAENISPERVFFHRFLRPDGGDCLFAGRLLDLPPHVVLTRFGRGDLRRFDAIEQAFRGSENPPFAPTGPMGAPPCEASSISFLTPELPLCWRVLEVWTAVREEVLRVHDPELGMMAEIPADYLEQAIKAIGTVNRCRTGKRPSLSWDISSRQQWERTMLAPDGTVLDSRRADALPFVMALYPMIDGEVHSLVEDVIDQQKEVNNLVMLLDEVLRASAKGVVLFPADQLPRGMTWGDVRKIWSQPGGILPFRRTSKNVMPYQLNTATSTAGATDLLQTQLRLFDEISGTNASSRGAASTAKGAAMLDKELEQATMAVRDILSSFDAMLARRDRLLLR